MSPILEVEHLNVYYKQYGKSIFDKPVRKHVVQDVSFTVGEGEIVGLLGESGCGKSTIAKAVLGMVPDVEGSVKHYSEHPQMVFQDPFGSLNPAKTIEFILMEPLRNLTKLPKNMIQQRAEEMIERVGLEKRYLKHYPKELSGGQRQRISIAAALMLEPRLLIADEPVSALDVTIQAQVIELLLRLQKEMDLSILFISHDLRVVYQMSNRVMIMNQGKIVEQGDVDSVYRNPENPYTRALLESAHLQL